MANENKVITLDSLKTIFSAFKSDILENILLGNNQQDNTDNIEPMHDDIPTLYISGEVPTKKENVNAKIEYVSKTHSFSTYLKYKLQGSYTMSFPKKNFTIQLFSDENRLIPLYKDFKNWGKSNQFVLKADYADITHARNVVCAKLWSKVVASRADYDTLPDGIKNSPNNCATDGFPVLVYLNGEYQGLYTLVIPKGAWMFGMDKNNENHVVLNAETNDERNEVFRYNPCNFNAEWSGEDGKYWSYEVGNNATDSFNRLYTYMYASHNQTMLERYLDIQSAIDYYIFQSVIFGLDGLAKNMILMTYDKTKWYLSAYDMDSTFGLLTERNMSEYIDAMPWEEPHLCMYSALYPYLENNYMEQIRNRYEELRNGALSKQSIIKEFDSFINIYGEDLYIKDVSVYPNIPNVVYNNARNLRDFISKRLDVVDNYVLGGALNV